MNNFDNLDDLISSMIDTRKMIKSNDISPGMANADNNNAGKIISAYKLKLEYNKSRGKNPAIKFLDSDVDIED